MNLTLKVIGAFLLVVLFFVVYQVVISLKPTALGGFKNPPLTIGQTGGFHQLKDIRLITGKGFDTIALYTDLNRSSALEDIATPVVNLTATTPNQLHIKLSDTAISSNLIPADLNRLLKQNFTNSPVTEITLTQPNNPDSQELLVTLTKPTTYRLTADPQNAGIIYLDVLK